MHSECVILIAFSTVAIVARTHYNITLYIYCLPCFSFTFLPPWCMIFIMMFIANQLFSCSRNSISHFCAVSSRSTFEPGSVPPREKEDVTCIYDCSNYRAVTLQANLTVVLEHSSSLIIKVNCP